MHRKLFLQFLLCLFSFSVFAEDVCSRCSFADLVESLIPTVVNISTVQKVKKPDMSRNMQFPDSFQDFREFFERFGPFSGARPEREVISLGSGFVVSEDGVIVTNNHVIENASEITVRFSDDSEAVAKLLAWDAKTDIAILKVDVAHKLSYAFFGDSDSLRVGDTILAIGNPFGLGSSLSAGVVSARSRSINTGLFDDFLQIDAAINRGNSGGPLFDINGKVVGVNTAIASPSGGSVGVGFALNSNVVDFVVKSLQEHGRVIRGYIGVRVQAITNDIAESINQKEGALIVEVTKGGAAEKAGINVGDIILEFNDTHIKEMRQLPKVVSHFPIGKKAKAVVLRNGKKITLHLKVEEMENEDYAKKQNEADEAYEIHGMFLEDLNKNTRESFAIPQYVKSGILISGVKQGGQAERRGLRRGNIITRVVTRDSDSEIRGVKDFKQQLEGAKKSNNKSVLLLVMSFGSNISSSSFVVLDLE